MELAGGSVMMCVAIGSVFVARGRLFRLVGCRLMIEWCMSVVVDDRALGEMDV